MRRALQPTSTPSEHRVHRRRRSRRTAPTTRQEALIEVYKKLRPGDPPTGDNAEKLVESLFFNFRRYDLGRVGRYKFNKKLDPVAERMGIELPRDQRTISREDIAAIVGQLIELNNGARRSRTTSTTSATAASAPIGELIQNAFRVGLLRMERVVKERMTIQEIDKATPNALINIRPVVAAMKEFFGGSQLSPVHGPDQPAGRADHKRRLSALGPGGLSPRARRLRRARRAPQPLRPHLPDRDAGRPEHRPDRLARDLRPHQRVRLHRDALPQGQAHRRARRPGRSRPEIADVGLATKSAQVVLKKGARFDHGGRRRAARSRRPPRSPSGRASPTRSSTSPPTTRRSATSRRPTRTLDERGPLRRRARARRATATSSPRRVRSRSSSWT